MPKVTYVLTDGLRREIEASDGTSLMEAAIRNNVEGIDAECGGCLSCATCHVYVAEEWLTKLPPPNAEEQEMLGFVAAERRLNSRLSCEIKLKGFLSGIVVNVPPRQS